MLFFQKIPAFLIPMVLCIAIVSEIYLCLLNTFFELAFFSANGNSDELSIPKHNIT